MGMEASLLPPGFQLHSRRPRREQNTDERPGPEDPLGVFRGFCSFPLPSESLSSSSSYPRMQCAAGLPTLRGNIFTFLPYFSRPCYIRKIPAAPGKEVEGGKNSEFVTDSSSFLPCPVSLSTIGCYGDNGTGSHGRAGLSAPPVPWFDR